MASYAVCIHLVEIGALGGPHGRGAQAEDEGCGDEGVELGVELGRHVGRVAEDAHHQRPLHLEVLDEDAGHEHAGQDEADVDRGGGPGAQVVHHVDGALQLAHGLERGEEQEEGEGNEENILVYLPLLPLPLLRRHVLVDCADRPLLIIFCTVTSLVTIHNFISTQTSTEA